MRGTGGITKTPAVKPLSIELLGTPRVSLEGRGLRFGRKKSLALLCYLAVEGGEHRRSELAELLWPRSDGRRARADLRSTLAGLRKALVEDAVRGRNGSEGVRPLTIDGELLGIDPRGFELDLRKIETAVSLARNETSNTSRPSRSAANAVSGREVDARLEGILGVYRG